jgi:hypothetical protein
MRSRASRRRLSDNDIRCSASDRRWFPARPAQHVHRRRNNGKGRIPSALASAHGRNGKRRVETSSAGRAGAHRPSEALHPTRSSDVLPRIARERVPTVPHVAKTRRNVKDSSTRGLGDSRRTNSLRRGQHRSVLEFLSSWVLGFLPISKCLPRFATRLRSREYIALVRKPRDRDNSFDTCLLPHSSRCHGSDADLVAGPRLGCAPQTKNGIRPRQRLLLPFV